MDERMGNCSPYGNMDELQNPPDELYQGGKRKRRLRFKGIAKNLFGKRSSDKGINQSMTAPQSKPYPDSPQRSASMPHEITIGAPPSSPSSSSLISAVTGITGMPVPRQKGRSIITSVLPSLLTSPSNDTSGSGTNGMSDDGGIGSGTGTGGTNSETLENSASSNIEDLSVNSPPLRVLLGPHMMSSTTSPQSAGYSVVKRKKFTENFLATSERFDKLVDWAFQTIDADNSESVDKQELYTGLLLIHIQIGAYAGAAACVPASREYCNQIFDQVDLDGSGKLSKDEFREVMITLCSAILVRIVLQWALYLMIMPLAALYIMEFFEMAVKILYSIWYHIDENETITESAMTLIIRCLKPLSLLVPPIVKMIYCSTCDKIQSLVSNETLQDIPLTIFTSGLSAFVVPWVILKADSFYSNAVSRKSIKLKKQ